MRGTPGAISVQSVLSVHSRVDEAHRCSPRAQSIISLEAHLQVPQLSQQDCNGPDPAELEAMLQAGVLQQQLESHADEGSTPPDAHDAHSSKGL